MTIQINNYNELLEFIKREDTNPKQATEVVCKALNVISIVEMTKEEVITATEYLINEFYINYTGERPIFLTQKEPDFKIKDLFS